ncbi:NAD(P) transhydrogenase subunit alpha [Halorhabdus sp. CUG00001]|uniref:NAD(P) transhydrogenase subunit alpha n=1 Tax=Halorhabdus sp. CUG00001 TaxID=2600297 RepID=UPI00131AFB45|nr:NAD(P) transhydrogenase subunit alpha [Halorhabdus sp. CUG00001]
MIVGVPSAPDDETRVGMVPAVAADLIDAGHAVHVESGAGDGAGWADDAYRDVGCEISDDRGQILADADVVFEVAALGAVEEANPEQYRADQAVIGLLGPFDVADQQVQQMAETGVDAFALELVPRTSRAQSMDANSSQANVAGYKAAVQAAGELDRMVPMQMTAAGTVQPAEVFVIGAGVAGLQAISTANRLGASVKAYDIRPEAAEEITSVGAEFVELDVHAEDASDEEGHATEQDEEFYRKQRTQLGEVVAESDALITTAAVASGDAPRLVTDEAIAGMDDGSVVVDLAAGGGGNCDPTVPDERVDYEGVTVFGPTNLPATVPRTASQLYANNLVNFLENMLEDDELVIDTDDEIVDATLLTHDGTVRNPHRDDGSDDEPSDGEDAAPAQADADGGDGT